MKIVIHIGTGEAQAAAWAKSVLESNTTPDTVIVVEEGDGA